MTKIVAYNSNRSVDEIECCGYTVVIFMVWL